MSPFSLPRTAAARSVVAATLPALAAALAARPAAAQWNVARFADAPNRVYSTAGLDPSLVTALGYARVAAVDGHAFELLGEAGVVPVHLDPRVYRLRLGARTSLARWGAARLVGGATFVARGADNAIYRATSFGAELTTEFGVFRPRWFAAAEAGKDKAIATHLTHSDYYRRYFYPDAKDGWYVPTGGTLHYGGTAGLTLGRTELAGRLGWQRTEAGNTLTPPAYATLGLGIHF